MTVVVQSQKLLTVDHPNIQLKMHWLKNQKKWFLSFVVVVLVDLAKNHSNTIQSSTFVHHGIAPVDRRVAYH